MNTEISASRIQRLARALPVELCFADSYSRETIAWLEQYLKTPIYDWLSAQIPPLAETLAHLPQEAAIRLECFDNLKGPIMSRFITNHQSRSFSSLNFAN